MNIVEFSIACKLISLKLRNVEVPKLLPPTLLASLKHVGTPIRTPTGTMSPVEGYKQFMPQIVPIQQPIVAAVIPAQVAPMMAQQQQFQQPVIPQQVVMPQQQQPIMPVAAQPMISATQQMMYSQIPQQNIIHSPQQIQQQPQQPIMAPTQAMGIPQQPLQQTILTQQHPQMIPMATVMPSQQPLMASNIITSAPVQMPSKPPLIDQLSNSSLLDSLVQVQPTVAPSGPLPAAPTPTPPQSGNASRSMSFSEKAPSIESP